MRWLPNNKSERWPGWHQCIDTDKHAILLVPCRSHNLLISPNPGPRASSSYNLGKHRKSALLLDIIPASFWLLQMISEMREGGGYWWDEWEKREQPEENHLQSLFYPPQIPSRHDRDVNLNRLDQWYSLAIIEEPTLRNGYFPRATMHFIVGPIEAYQKKK